MGAVNFYDCATLLEQYAQYSDNYIPNTGIPLDVLALYKQEVMDMSWPENQGILFFYISKTLEMIRISFMASLLNAVL